MTRIHELFWYKGVWGLKSWGGSYSRLCLSAATQRKSNRLEVILQLRVRLPLKLMLLQLCLNLWDSMDCSWPGASAHGLFMQEYWSKLPCPPPGDLPDPWIWRLLHWQAVSLPLAPPGKTPPPLLKLVSYFPTKTWKNKGVKSLIITFWRDYFLALEKDTLGL